MPYHAYGNDERPMRRGQMNWLAQNDPKRWMEEPWYSDPGHPFSNDEEKEIDGKGDSMKYWMKRHEALRTAVAKAVELGLIKKDPPPEPGLIYSGFMDSMEERFLEIGLPLEAHDELFAILIVENTPDIKAQMGIAMEASLGKEGIVKGIMGDAFGSAEEELDEGRDVLDVAKDINARLHDKMKDPDAAIQKHLEKEIKDTVIKNTTMGVFNALRKMGVEVAPDILEEVVKTRLDYVMDRK